MNKVERMTEIAKASPDFGKRVGYKMCVVDELHDIKELEKEAERFVSEKSDKGNFDTEQFGKAYFSESSMKQALVKFTEQRKVRTEIEINGVRFSSISDMLQYMDKLRDHIIDLENKNAELKAQIEKMKCCQNCSHLCSRCELGIDGCYVCSKWEIRENDRQR